MYELYGVVGRKNKEILALKRTNKELLKQIGCLMADAFKKNRRIDILRRKIKDLEDDNFELRHQ